MSSRVLVNSKSKSAVLKPLKVAVIGAGVMGGHHLRICDQIKEVELVAVVDIDQERADAMAEQYGIASFTNVEEIFGKVEAVIIAVPSVLHLEVGRQCLSQNIHCLIEKPLAVTEKQCLELIRLAKKNKVMLLVGHIERFNAAIQQLAKELSGKQYKIQAIEAKRLGYNVERALDVDVILDLMMHDLDILLSFMDKPVKHYAISRICQMKKNEADFASALIDFEGGAVANLSSSRITAKKIRSLDITTDKGFFSLDFLKQEIWLHRANGQVEQIAVNKQDALTSEIITFVHSVQSGKALGVTGDEALKSLKLVWQLQERAGAGTSAGRMTDKKYKQSIANASV